MSSYNSAFALTSTPVNALAASPLPENHEQPGKVILSLPNATVVVSSNGHVSASCLINACGSAFFDF